MQDFVKRRAQAQWHSVSSRDALERRVAKIQTLSLSAQQQLVVRTAGDKFRGLSEKPVTDWPRSFLKDWDPKKDFAYAMLHAERLIKILVDEAVVEILLEQARKHPERRDVLERYLDRAEPRCRFLHDEISNTGARLLAQLAGPEAEAHKVAS